MSSSFAENKLAVCTPHKLCLAGQWIKAAGTKSTDTECVDCAPGTWRRLAPTSNAFAESKGVCTPHKLCSAGQWIKAAGNTKMDTKCTDCAVGTWRETGPTRNVAEREADVCAPHSLCGTGFATETAGTSTTDTVCVRTKDTSDGSVVNKGSDKGCIWGQSNKNVKCNQGAGEVPLRESSVRTSSLEECKVSCEYAVGCQSVTYFKTGFCAHFSTPCTNTKKSGKAVVERLETACTMTREFILCIQGANRILCMHVITNSCIERDCMLC